MPTDLWALLKGQPTPVPGIVIADPATALKCRVTTAASAKPKEYVVKLTNPVACSAVPPPPTELKIKDAQAYILANGVKADTDAMGDALTESPAQIHKIGSSLGSNNQRCGDPGRQGRPQRRLHREPEGAALLQGCSGAGCGARRCSLQWNWTAPTTPTRRLPAAATAGPAAQIVLSDGFVQPEKRRTGASRRRRSLPPRTTGSSASDKSPPGIPKGRPLRRAALFLCLEPSTGFAFSVR